MRLRLFRPAMLLALFALAAVLLTGAVAMAAEGEIPLAVEQGRFEPGEIRVKAGTPFVLVVTNREAKPIEFESKDLKVEKVVPAGKTVKVKVRALRAGTYQFLDDFNQATTGRIVAE